MFRVKSLVAAAGLGLLSIASYASVAKADVFNILQNSTSCSSGLMCNNSNSVIATITATNSGSNLNLVYHIVDTNFFFLQAGATTNGHVEPPNPRGSRNCSLSDCYEWNTERKHLGKYRRVAHSPSGSQELQWGSRLHTPIIMMSSKPTSC